MIKRILSVLLTAIMCISLASPALAVPSLSANAELTQIASTLIETTSSVTAPGSTQTTYSNIDVFISYVQKNCAVSDYDLARFVMDYTEQYYNENMPNSTVLEVLTCSEVIVNHETVFKTENGTQSPSPEQELVPLDNWTDGPINFTTTAVRTFVNNETYYVLTARATWNDTPSAYNRDAFVLTSNATFDSSYTESAYFEHTEYCVTHNHTLHQYMYVDRNNPIDTENGSTMKLTYESGYPGVLFDTMAYCDQSDAYLFDPAQSRITVYISLRVKPTLSSHNAQASYGHKTYGIGDISWTIGTDGLTPSFSVRGHVDDYYARPITFP